MGALWVLGGSQARRPKAKAKNEAQGDAEESNLVQGKAEASARRQRGSTLSNSCPFFYLEEA